MSADRSKPTVLIGVAIVVAVALGVWSLTRDDTSPSEELAERIPPETFIGEVARQWAEAWIDNDAASMRELAGPPVEDLEEKVASFRDGLRITALRASPRPPVVRGDTATVALDVAADIDGMGTWTFVTRLPMTLPADAPSPADWKVTWSRAVLHPALVGERRLNITREYAPRAPLLAADGSPLTGGLAGRVGTAEADGNGHVVGDPAGVSGLQAAFDRELGGTASGDVQVLEGGAVVEVLDRILGRPPQPVRASIDPRVQAIADAQLAALLIPAREGPPPPPPPEGEPPPPEQDRPKVSPPAAVVVLRPSTGEVLAAASNPPGGFNRALNGRYPPGSTFKVVTSTALLLNGITPDSPTSCPDVATVNGRGFRNAEGAALGDIPFRRAFYESCNTAFVQLATEIDGADLLAAAERFGFNAPLGLEVPAEVASFPEPSGPVDQASAAIGQGRVLATPLQMASVAATVASGVRRPTTLRAVDAPVAGQPLPDGVAATLQELMLLVVARGTGTAARLPGAAVAGKTGTAEFGTESPPRTHAWFIGFRGDVAIAVVVEDGGFGGQVAAPVAREILRQVG